jgi:hypothetical protein
MLGILEVHIFHVYICRLLINLPVSVINLGDTTRQEYKKSSAILSNSKTFQGLLQGYKYAAQKYFFFPDIVKNLVLIFYFVAFA